MPTHVLNAQFKLFMIQFKLSPQVIPRYNVRGRNRSSSAKFSNTTSLLPIAPQVRSSSFRVNRNTGQVAGNVMPSFCQHIKYCCLHQSLTNSSAKSARLDSELIDRSNRNEDYGESRPPTKSAASQFKIDEMSANSGSSGFGNFSDDEKSMKLTRKFSVDASINLNLNPSTINNKSLQHSYESFDTRKCNCGKSFSLTHLISWLFHLLTIFILLSTVHFRFGFYMFDCFVTPSISLSAK